MKLDKPGLCFFFKLKALVDLQNLVRVVISVVQSITRSSELGIFIPSMIPCVRKNSELLSLRIQQESDNSEFT